jgi:CheY-like chemotaxis protein
VTSKVGVGSTFWFTVRMEVGDGAPPVLVLPPAPVVVGSHEPKPRTAEGGVSAVAREFQAALQAAGRSEVRVLLVEDNAANMRVTKALLEILGCTVTPAFNGLAAVEAYRTGAFDLVLMDCQMPEMDGYEATRTIRQFETVEGRHTPIVALTAHAMAGSRESSLAAGMDDQLTKPLTMAALTAKLVEWLTDARSVEPVA